METEQQPAVDYLPLWPGRSVPPDAVAVWTLGKVKDAAPMVRVPVDDAERTRFLSAQRVAMNA